MTYIQIENQQLVSLAVKCKFISASQEQQVLSGLIEAYQNDPEHSVVTIFIEKQILTQEKINALIALRKHLKVKMLDKRFGEIGISNRFITPTHVENALNAQDAFFRENQESKKIGDILVEKNEMSQADRTAILLTQDRIEDDILEQAIYDIATSEMERMTINKRFGAIAVKYNFITIEQLNQALRVQKNKAGPENSKQYLGKILQELFKLTDRDILSILKIQKQFEKDRLSLEKAVTLYKSEISSSKRFNQLFEFTISRNKMQAFVQRKIESVEQMEPAHFYNWLKLNGIRFGLINKELIKVFLSDSETGEKITIAKGKPPTLPSDEIVQLYFDTSVPTDEQSTSRPQVKKGTVIATIQPHKPGKPGTDVMGHVILPSEPRMHLLMCGRGVVKNGEKFIADQDGVPLLFKQRTLFIEPCSSDRQTRRVKGHIDTDTKESYLDVNLKVDGSITQGGAVACHDLSITGDILGKADASGDIDIRGNIGENESVVHKSEYHTVVISGGNLKVKKDISQARVVVSRNVTAPNASVFSSDIHAMESIVLNNVHSSEMHPSVLEIGHIPNFRIEAVNRSIDKEMAVLRTLQNQDELDELALKLQNYFNVQNEYLEKRQILTYLLKILEADKLKHIASLGDKIQLYEPEPSDNGDVLLNSENALAYMDEEVKQVEGLSPDQQKERLSRRRVDVSKLYRAAANRAERYSAEYRARQKIILDKVAEKQHEINQQSQKIEDLRIQKDFLLSKQPEAQSFKPMIRVKNMIEEHTVIKGPHTSVVIKKSIYGVKIREIKDAVSGNFEIAIEGYYD